MTWLDRLRTGRVRAVMVGLGLALVARGLWSSGPSASTPRATLSTFARALETGDRDLALSLFPAESREGLPTFVPEGVWTPARRFQWQLKSLDQIEEFATARLYIRDASYYVEPIVELRRNGDGVWQITSLELDRVDPRFADDKKRQAEVELDALATDLAAALRDSPTVLAAEPEDAASLR
jgi:hypothetical protein